MAWISPAKVAGAIAAGVVVLALATEFAARGAWSSAEAWLRPPYLYIVLNGIILSIAASSRFHINNSRRDHRPEEKLSAATSVAEDHHHHHRYHHYHHRQLGYDRNVIGPMDHDDQEINVEVTKEVIKESEDMKSHDHDGDILKLSAEKPLISPARLGHRKPAEPTTPAGGSTVSHPGCQETLENTWKAITEGRSTPLSRHVKKCDTWENQGRHVAAFEVGSTTVKKSESMFRDRTNHQLTLLRKEPSLSQDELNDRVEAFIRKFNLEMRMQRQESLDQYMDMINRGAH